MPKYLMETNGVERELYSERTVVYNKWITMSRFALYMYNNIIYKRALLNIILKYSVFIGSRSF